MIKILIICIWPYNYLIWYSTFADPEVGTRGLVPTWNFQKINNSFLHWHCLKFIFGLNLEKNEIWSPPGKNSWIRACSSIDKLTMEFKDTKYELCLDLYYCQVFKNMLRLLNTLKTYFWLIMFLAQLPVCIYIHVY